MIGWIEIRIIYVPVDNCFNELAKNYVGLVQNSHSHQNGLAPAWNENTKYGHVFILYY